jgi:alcohol dehydrogenase (cytochrome c)
MGRNACHAESSFSEELMRMVRRFVLVLMAVSTAAALAAQQNTGAPVVPEEAIAPPPKLPLVTALDLRDGLKNPGRWLTYSGDYSGKRHSPLTQITPANVSRLSSQWTFQAEGMPVARGFEGTPLMMDGVLYITGNNNYAWAIDARSGRQIWRYRRLLPPALTYGGVNPSNRGFAAFADKVFMGTLDAHILAFNRDTGKIVWDTVVDDYKVGHAVIAAPLIVKDKVVVGNSGGDIPTRGFIDAYDVQTGKRAWRFYTIPAEGEPGSETWSKKEELPHGGGATWVTGSYDPESNLIYWGVGNPSPSYFGGDREGDNLYTASIVAFDADTGKLRWHYQFTPHDLHDWDSNHVPVLGEVTIGGRQRKVVMVANRNGFFYTLDRLTGELLVGKPYTATRWAREIGKDGKPIVLNQGVVPPGGSEATTPCVPDLRGGTVYNPPSFDPAMQLFFVMARETCAYYTPFRPELQVGKVVTGGGMKKLADPDFSALRALDARTGEMKWEYRFPTPSLAGVMSTASGLVFAGNQEGEFGAFDARSGKRLWFYRTGSPIWGAAAMTYMLDGRQYVLIESGTTIMAFALPG